MEREVGGGIGMGNTCKPMAVSFQCMTKSTTIKKKKIKSQAEKQNKSEMHLLKAKDWGISETRTKAAGCEGKEMGRRP